MNNIEVFVRHCYYSPNTILPNRHRPTWFDKKKIWNNLVKTSNVDNVNINVIYDNHFGDYDKNFYGDFKNITEINCGTEASSFLATLDIIKSFNYSDNTIIYFLEDDYLHLDGWHIVLEEGLAELNSDYVSLYDHLDKYLHYDNLMSQIFVTTSCHWRTTPSTCNTFACKMKTLREDFNIQRKFSISSNNDVSRDHDKFVELTSIERILVTSLPGYSTHCDHLQSPTINWGNII